MSSFSRHTIRRIAYTTDSTTESFNGLSWAANLARANHSELLLLYIVPPPTPIFELESLTKAEAEMALALLLGKLEKLDIKARGFLLTGTGSVDGQILRAAKLAQVDLIVMEGPRQSWVERLLAGKLASRVITRAHCPVLIIPGNGRRPKTEFAYRAADENKIAS